MLPILRKQDLCESNWYLRVGVVVACIATLGPMLRGESTISTEAHYAYGANIGWIDARPSTADGARLAENTCAGYLYAANVSWINLGEFAHSVTTTVIAPAPDTDGHGPPDAWELAFFGNLTTRAFDTHDNRSVFLRVRARRSLAP